jgi:GrpB-like predicted nucleotidyltransferase (UPF0157 family)
LFPGFEARGEKRPLEPVEIVPYDPAWPHLYEVWRARLDTAIGAAAERIEHVGSTSVPGLPAKPIVDIQVSVGELSKEVRYVPACESLGLQLRGSDDEHRYLQPSPDRPREVHVHVCPSGGRWERIHLLFRDFLRSDARARDSYAEMKHRQAETWKDDRWAYTESKTDLILQLMDRAEEWASRVGWTVAGSCSR